MSRVPRAVDRLVRAGLALPGWVVERLDGQVRLPPEPPFDDLFERVRASARHPESRLILEGDVHHLVVGDYVVGYQVRGTTAFAIGGLNAPPADRRAVLRAYRDLADVRRRLLFPLRRAELRAAVEVGFTPVQVGVEAVLDVPGLTFSGGRFETVRNMRNRARRRGVTVAEVDPADHRAELARVHAAWLDSKRPSWRMKLLVGSPSLDRPLDRRYLVARTAEGVVAFVTLLPGAPGQWGLDVMARHPSAPAGTMDLLIYTAACLLRDEGASTLSLGACPMAGVPLEGRGWLLRRIFRLLYQSHAGNQLFGFRRLHRFKAKFRPRWEPVYLAVSPRLSLWSLYLGCRMWGLY